MIANSPTGDAVGFPVGERLENRRFGVTRGEAKRVAVEVDRPTRQIKTLAKMSKWVVGVKLACALAS